MGAPVREEGFREATAEAVATLARAATLAPAAATTVAAALLGLAADKLAEPADRAWVASRETPGRVAPLIPATRQTRVGLAPIC